jgi:hypothetical protein
VRGDIDDQQVERAGIGTESADPMMDFVPPFTPGVGES